MTDLSLPPARCFQGVIPAAIATSDAEGAPNVTYLSQVYAVDERHVALSCQFFNKTKRNVLANPFASVQMYDPVTFEAYRLELRYLRAESSGPLFDAMALRIEAIASHTGMKGVFRLISADVYRVESCTKLDAFIDPPVEPEIEDPGGPRSELRALQMISQHVCKRVPVPEMLDHVLARIESALGFAHAVLLLADASGTSLEAVATRGYEGRGVGAQVRVGDGFIGTVAAQRKILRMSGVEDELRYGRAIRSTFEQQDGARRLSPEVPLPGLSDPQSHLALPLVLDDRLVGVLAVESRQRLAFDEWDEAFLEIIANQLALGIGHGAATLGQDAAPRRARRFRYFARDEVVFVDDEYLVRNVPGKILWKLLRAHQEQGRTEFSNRELRLDPWLGLPATRDNLESRLALLRKRLDERCPDLKLTPTARGRFRLEADCEIQLLEPSDASEDDFKVGTRPI